MNLVEVEFYSKSEPFEEIHDLVTSWKNNGQALLDSSPIFKSADGVFIIILYVPFVDSLDKKYNNIYVNQRIERILNSCSEIKFKNRGYCTDENLTKEEFDNSNALVLYYNNYFLDSPIKELYSFKSVPLIYLPKSFDNTDYWNIVQWIKTADASETLSDSTEVINGNEYSDLYNTKSLVNQNGRALCSKLELILRKKVFYFQNRNPIKSNIIDELNFSFDDSTKNSTFFDLDNDFFQYINISERLVSNISPSLLESCRNYYKLNKLDLKLPLWNKKI